VRLSDLWNLIKISQHVYRVVKKQVYFGDWKSRYVIIICIIHKHISILSI